MPHSDRTTTKARTRKSSKVNRKNLSVASTTQSPTFIGRGLRKIQEFFGLQIFAQEHAKMHVPRKEPARENFRHNGKAKLYASQNEEQQKKNNAGRLMSKRIAGYMKARTRKDQVERDRLSGSKPYKP